MQYIKTIVAILCLDVLLIAPSIAQNQKKIVVKDENGNPISGVSVTIGEGSRPVTTDEKGEFIIQVEGNTPVLLKAEGYASQIFNVSADTELKDFVLVKTPYLMGDKDNVNVPFGTFKQRLIPGAVVALDPEDILKYDRQSYFTGILNGRIPGLFGSTSNRQTGSMLVVIDGIPRPASDYNVEQIEQITVLKDLSASILYGAQANNGVILITTKRGEPLKKSLHFTAENGFHKPVSYPDYLAAGDYMTLYNEALANDGLSPRYSAADIDSTVNGGNPVRFPDEDYFNSTYLKNWYSYQNIVGEASGGSDKAQYYLNLSWRKSNNILKLGEGGNSSNTNLNLRANINYKMTDEIKLTFNAATVFKLGSVPRYTSSSMDFWNLAATLRPNDIPILIPASLMKDKELLKAAKLIDNKYLLGGTSQYTTNIYGELLCNGPRKTSERLIELSTGLEYDLGKITKGLKMSAFLSFDMNSLFFADIMNSYAVYQPVYAMDTISKWNKFNKDAKVEQQTLADITFYRRIGVYGTMDYNRIFNNKHEITINALAYRDQYSTEGLSQMTKHLHFGIRANYSYKNKYTAEATGVAVGSVKLYETAPWGFSKGVGLGWVVSEEDFLKDKPVINYLRIRANWAMNNSDEGMTYYNLGRNLYKSSSSYAYKQGGYSNASMILQSGNPDMGFEKRENVNVGFESKLMDYKLGLDAAYFYYKTYDIISTKSNGFPAYIVGNPYMNFGSNQTQGAEAGLNYECEIGGFRINIGSNFVYSVPKVLVIDELNFEESESYRRQTGRATDAIFGLVALGLFKDQDDINASTPQTFGTVKPGDIKYQDINNDGLIDDLDQKLIGNTNARIQYGFNIDVKYKSFELFALGTGQTGSERYFTNSYYWVYGNRKYSEVVWNRWTPATAETATYPRLSSLSNSNNFRNSTFWLYSYNWFNLSLVQLSYTLPKIAGIEEASFFVRCNNLALFSKIKDKAELNIGAAPQTRVVSFGLKVSL